MSDVIQDIRDYFADRFSSPFWISFIVAWLIINWQLSITAVFETEKFTVAFISDYLNTANTRALLYFPTLIALAYAIFSGAIKETIDILSKLIRSLFSYIDRKGWLYQSISLIEHEKQISRLKRQLQKIESDKTELAELHTENKNLEEQILNFKAEIKDRTDYHTQNSKLAQENHLLNEKISKLEEKISQHKELLEKPETTNPIDYKTKNREIKKDTKLYEKIISRSSDNIQSLLEDPSSLASLFIILYLAKAGHSYNMQEIFDKSGFKNNKVTETINNALDAKLIHIKSEQILPTELGLERYIELMKDKSLSELTQLFELADKETETEILELLKEKALPRKKILQLINFNPNADKVLSQLRETKKITLSGSVYFINSQYKTDNP